jgi:hypothetical protein
MQSMRKHWLAGSSLLGLIAALAVAGCYHTPVDTSEFAQGPASGRMPSPAKTGEADGCNCYEDSLTGGQVFAMYCNYCHNAPALGERNFANFRNVASHMRIRANLTGKEYARLMEFLRRWHDVPPPTSPPEPSPKLLIFSQPMNELRDQPPAKGGAAEPKGDAAEPKGGAAGGQSKENKLP